MVITLIAIMTGISVPAIRTALFTDQLKASSRELVGLITRVSQQAVREQIVYTLVVNFEENTVTQKEKQKQDDEEQLDKTVLKIKTPVKIADIASVNGGIKNNGQAEIVFTKKGYVDKTYIHLRDDDRDMTIMLSPFLGFVEIADSYVSLE